MMDIKQNRKVEGMASRSKSASKKPISDENTLEVGRAQTESKQLRIRSRTNGNEEHKAFWDTTWPSLEKNGWKMVPSPADAQRKVFIPNESDLSVKSRDRLSFDKIDDVIKFVNDSKDTTGSPEDNGDEKSSEYFLRNRKRAKLDQGGIRQRENVVPKKVSVVIESPIIVPTSGKSDSSTTKIDDSWKAGNLIFMKRNSSVGPEYQVSEIPKAGSYLDPQNEKSDVYSEIVWSSATARRMGVQMDGNCDPLSTVPFSIRETAMLELAQRNYSTDELDDIVKNLSRHDGSTWSKETKDKYHSEMFRLRKNILAVSKSLGIDFSSAMTYYLGFFKKSKDYRVLKQVRAEEKVLKIEATGHMVDKCGICGEGGSLLICDECEGEYHLACLKPPLASVPEGRWECDECVDRKLIVARDSILSSTPLCEKISLSDQVTKDVKDVTVSSESERSMILYKPCVKALNDLCQFVHDANKKDAQKTDPKSILVLN